jgi:hypothetical protein
MPVDVVTEIEIGRLRDVVASYASEPGNATAWYQNITAAVTATPGPMAAGSRIAFTAVFLGRRLTYTYEVSEFVPGERLVMRTSEGPFPMETTYAWRDARPGATLMTLRNRGEPSGFSGLAAPLVARSMRSANRKDLARLKAILESEGAR